MITLMNAIIKQQNTLNDIVYTKVFRNNKKVDAICITTLSNGVWNYVEITEEERNNLCESYLSTLGICEPIIDILITHKVPDIINISISC